MTKLEDTNKWPTVVRMAGEGASLREIAEEVDATPGAINVALKRMGIEKAPAPPGPRARRGASPPPAKAPKAPKVKAERQPRQKAPKAPTFPSVFIATLTDLGMHYPTPNKKYTEESVSTPTTMGEVLQDAVKYDRYNVTEKYARAFNDVLERYGFPAARLDLTTPEWIGEHLGNCFKSLGLMCKNDNLSDDNTDDDRIVGGEFVSAVNDPDVSGEDDNGDCDGSDPKPIVMPVESYVDNDGCIDGSDEDGETVRFSGYVAEIPVTVIGDEEISNGDPRASQTVIVDPNEVTLRGEVIDDWGTPPSFTIPSDEELASMNRDDLRKLAANPACRDAFVLKGYSKMSPESLRKALAQVRNDS